MINDEFLDKTGRRVTLHDVDDANWRAVADVAPLDDQREYVAPSAARYLLLSLREGVWNSLAVCADDAVTGHVMWARDDEDGSYWIGGMMIDASEQGRGLGRAAVRTLVARLAERDDCTVIRLSYQPDNTGAGHLYTSLGFQVTSSVEGDEIVASLSVRDTAGAPAAPTA